MAGFDPELYARGLREANRREQQQIEQRLQDARTEAERLITLLKNSANCSDACLFGSVADGSARRLDFDIDIAVWGGDILAAQEIADDSIFKVDIVQYEHAPEHLQHRIDEYRR